MLHGALVADYHGRSPPASWRVLTSTPAPLSLRRTAADTLELWHMADATWLDTMSARIFRPPPRTMSTGERVAAGPVTMEVVADREGRPERVRATFDPPIDDPRWAFFVLRGMQLRPIPMPTVGSITFAPVPDDR
jgi:hypothetical protein